MSGFKETISKAIGNSEIFNKTADFISDKQKKFKAEKTLEDANIKLTALYLELGKTAHKKRPLTAGRTSTVIRAEIDAQLIVVANCQAIVDELNTPKPEPEAEEAVAPDVSEEQIAPDSPDNKTEE